MKPNIVAEGTVCCAHQTSNLTQGKWCAVHILSSLAFVVTVTLSLFGGRAAADSGKGSGTLKVDMRRRVAAADAPDRFCVACEGKVWEPNETAVVICDMWNQHWCKGATERVAELAPVMNRVVAAARDRGVLIIHSPSGTIGHYENHSARQKAKDAPQAANLPEGIASWCQWKDETEKKAGYPIDHSDGGCDCQPRCKEGSPWTAQIDAVEIKDEDAISDSGTEIWNLLEQRGIRNVILMGVHTNMCVLGRPFGLRNLAKAGRNVVLMRDLTDTMYNSRQPPHVSHFTGTDLVVEHIEKYVCPTIISTVLTGEPPFRFANDKRPLVVFLSAENEYKAAETLPGFANELELHHGLRCEILQASTAKQGDEIHYISGMEILTGADLVVVYARRRAFPADQMKYLRDYLNRGRPLIGLRTASHAFDTRGSAPQGHAEWVRFDPEVLGGNYHGHYSAGPEVAVTPAAGGAGHPILKGIELPLLSSGSLYKASPLAGSATLLLVGTIPDNPPEPVAWTNRYKDSRVFYTSLGHPDDFAAPQFRKLLINAVFWAMDKPVPEATSAVAERVRQ
jgi:nicotinamidase-related amidase/type 1 glutamine amidotransferase